jgi:hypothetical protein
VKVVIQKEKTEGEEEEVKEEKVVTQKEKPEDKEEGK